MQTNQTLTQSEVIDAIVNLILEDRGYEIDDNIRNNAEEIAYEWIDELDPMFLTFINTVIDWKQLLKELAEKIKVYDNRIKG